VSSEIKIDGVGPLVNDAQLIERLIELAKSGVSAGIRLSCSGFDLYLKGSALRGKTRIRHSIRAAVLRCELPRLAEFENLTWLRNHDFRAPCPVSAGVVYLPGHPPFQFLATQVIEHTQTLDCALLDSDSEVREKILSGLGRDVARLHNLGFIHRDLYPRNLLIASDDPEHYINFIDAWRGGARRQLRGPKYDHACLMLHGAAWFTASEQAAYFAAYLASLDDQVLSKRVNLDPHAWLKRLAKERANLARRFNQRRSPDSPLPSAKPWKISKLEAEWIR
jgi:tRNA A-37 threonylcarbamoyl transferase component Bud32